MSIEELEHAALHCDSEEMGDEYCQELNVRIDRHYERQRRAPKCPADFVIVVEREWYSCVRPTDLWRRY